jgi:hypothetical protein
MPLDPAFARVVQKWPMDGRISTIGIRGFLQRIRLFVKTFAPVAVRGAEWLAGNRDLGNSRKSSSSSKFTVRVP